MAHVHLLAGALRAQQDDRGRRQHHPAEVKAPWVVRFNPKGFKGLQPVRTVRIRWRNAGKCRKVGSPGHDLHRPRSLERGANPPPTS